MQGHVALRKESVDRNNFYCELVNLYFVALRKESVDRNVLVVPSGCWLPDVALRKESVDRNRLGICHYRDDVSSLSARRAWIEIYGCYSLRHSASVALRKESVDRNTQRRDFKALGLLSLSARRAWIEIHLSTA